MQSDTSRSVASILKNLNQSEYQQRIQDHAANVENRILSQKLEEERRRRQVLEEEGSRRQEGKRRRQEEERSRQEEEFGAGLQDS